MQLQEKTSDSLEEESNADKEEESETNINIENDSDKEVSSEEMPPQQKVRRIKRLRYY